MTLGISTDKTWAANRPGRDWLIGNARLTQYSGLLLGAHIAHAGLIMFWAGSITVMEAGRFNPEIPLPDQGLTLIPHLATLGIGFDELGALTHSYAFFVVGILHLVASAVLGAGGLFHVFRGPEVLSQASGRATKFHYEWTDDKSLSFILGHHLIMLGLAALAFVLKATQWGGIYDASLHQVRLVEHPTLNPVTIFGYLVGLNHGAWTSWGMASVNSLEDIVGGHAWLGAMINIQLLLGAIALGGHLWHAYRTKNAD